MVASDDDYEDHCDDGLESLDNDDNNYDEWPCLGACPLPLA